MIPEDDPDLRAVFAAYSNKRGERLGRPIAFEAAVNVLRSRHPEMDESEIRRLTARMINDASKHLGAHPDGS